MTITLAISIHAVLLHYWIMEICIYDQNIFLKCLEYSVLFERSSVNNLMLIFDGSAIVNLSLWLCGAVVGCSSPAGGHWLNSGQSNKRLVIWQCISPHSGD